MMAPAQNQENAPAPKSDWEMLREKYGLNKKKKKKKKGQPSLVTTVKEAVAEADKKPRQKIEKEGFLISFRLSLAYRALERQEMVAGKPSLTPQKIRKRRQRHAQHHDKPVHKETGTNELEKARQKLKSNTQVSFWKQMISVRGVDKGKETAKEKETRARKKSPTGRPGTPKSTRSSIADPNIGDRSMAVREWERRKAVRKLEQQDKRKRLKSAKTPKKAGKSSAKDDDKVALLKGETGKRDDSARVKSPSPGRTPRDVTSAPAIIARAPSSRGSPRGVVSSLARPPSPQNTVSVSRPSSAHCTAVSSKSTVTLFSDDKPAKTKQRDVTIPLPGAVAPDTIESATTAPAADASGAQINLSVPNVSVKAPIVMSNYAKRLASTKLMIPKPDPADLCLPKTKHVPCTDASSVADDSKHEDDVEHRYRACQYLYNMCNCQKVGRPKTISKLLRFRKISGVIKIFGCPEERQTANMVCPFCQIFPRHKVYAWLNDQEVDCR